MKGKHSLQPEAFVPPGVVDRDLTINEAAAIGFILDEATIPGVDELRVQAEHARPV
jgi:hypothetical protein